MAQRKIPAFLSKEFHKLPAEKKKDLLDRYAAWQESDITKNLIEFLSVSISEDEKTESKNLFENEFKTMQDYAWHKGYRLAVRNVIKQLERNE